jgi:putative ABC transport system permease protein
MAWFNRLANIFRTEKLRDEIEEELRYHIDARTADNRAAGMSLHEARADALHRFGGASQALDQSRDADVLVWLETMIQDLRYGVRNLRSNPGVTVVALLSLALAIGASTAIFSVVNAVLLRALPYRDPDRITMLWVTNSLNGANEMKASVPNFEDWKQRTQTFEDLAMYKQGDSTLTFNGESDWIEYSWVYGDFFRLLGSSPALGRVFGADNKSAHEAVMSYRLWQSRFHGSPDALGRIVNLNGTDFEVVGVMPKGFDFPSSETQFWVSDAAFARDWQSFRQRRERGFGAVVGRLRRGVGLDRARAEMEVINRQLVAAFPRDNEERGIRIVPLAAQIHGKAIPFMLALLSGAVLLVLLIACANTASLLLARGAVRRREIALRTALGAGRTRILRQLVTESILLSSLAGIVGLPLAAWGIRTLVALAPPGIPRLGEAQLDARVLVFSLGLSLATGIVFGFAPAIRVSQDISNRRQTAGIESRGMHRAFVVAEVALSVVLLTGSGLLIRSFAAVQSVDPGFSMDRVLTAKLRFRNTLPRDRRAALFREAMKRVSEVPGVTAVGGIGQMFYTGEQGNFGLRAIEGRLPESREQWTPMTWSTISGDYFQALGVRLVRGRFFNDRDTADVAPVVIVNEAMARRYWPDEDPIGKGIKGFDARGHNDEWVRVIGVVKDVHNRGLERAPMAQVYEAQAQSLDSAENVVVRSAVSAEVLRDTIRSIDSTAVWTDVTTLEDRLRQQNAPRRFQTLLLSIFAAVALALAGAGIFAMMHYSVAQRTHEIGLRMALGARPAYVIWMVMREGVLLVGAGVAMGLAGSLVLTRSIRSLLFEVEPGDPATLSAVSMLLAGVALLACYLPAQRATRVDPMLALRCD